MGRCNQITNICVRVDWWKQSIGIDYYSGGGGSESATAVNYYDDGVKSDAVNYFDNGVESEIVDYVDS